MKPELKTLHKLPEIRPVTGRYQILVHSLTAYLHVKCSDNNKKIINEHRSVLQTDIYQRLDRHKLLIAIGLCRVRLVLVQKVEMQQCLSSSSYYHYYYILLLLLFDMADYLKKAA